MDGRTDKPEFIGLAAVRKIETKISGDSFIILQDKSSLTQGFSRDP